MSNLIKFKQIEGGKNLVATVGDAESGLVKKVNDLEDSIGEQISSAVAEVYQVTTDEIDVDQVVTDNDITPKAGDVLIVTTTTNGIKTAYQYDKDDGWIACDGNVDATKVILKDNITLAGSYTQVGNLTKSSTGTATFEVAGKSVATALTEMLSKREQPTITAQPAVSLTFSQAKDYEVGTTVNPSYTASLSAGSYKYGPATGITAKSWNVTDTDSHSSTSATGSFASFTVEDNDNYTITATAQYDAGAVANDNLGSPSNPTVQIAAGSKSKTSSAIRGYRSWFLYIGTDHTSPVDSTFIRSATNKGNGSSASTQTNVTIPGGTTRILVAIPKTVSGSPFNYNKTLKDVTDIDGMGLSAFGNFVLSTVSVEGANGYTATDYNVWVAENANGLAATHYTFTIS